MQVAPKPLTNAQMVYCLDGGTGTELERRGANMDPATWCAVKGENVNKILKEIHNDYVDAGARVIITNTFSSSRLTLGYSGWSDDDIRLYNIQTIGICKQVALERSTPERPVYCAGSLSHVFSFRHRSYSQEDIENTGNRGPTPVDLNEDKFRFAFREMIGYFEEMRCDLIMLEMMFAVDRMTWCLEECERSRLPIWCGITARKNEEGKLCAYYRAEDIPLANLFEIAAQYKCVQAIGIMHTPADIVGKCLDLLRTYWSGATYVYPEIGCFVLDGCGWSFTKIDEDLLGRYVREWAGQGAVLIGGCCGTTPKDITVIRDICNNINRERGIKEYQP